MLLSRYLLRLVCDITCYVIFYYEVFAVIAQFLGQKYIPMKFNAPGDLLSK